MPAAAPNATALRTVLIGATGRMGQALLQAAPAFPRLAFTAAIAAPGSPAQGRDAGELAGLGVSGVRVSADLAASLAEADLAIDFSTGEATRTNLAACRAAHTALLIGATGYPLELEGDFTAAARDIALLIAPNTSLGVAVMTKLVRLAARSLPAGFDIDVLDIHRRGKRDAPSGTALALGAAAREGRREGRREASGAQAPEREIEFASVRAGEVAGEHSVLFSGPAEQLSMTHRASDRSVYASGALAAALWLASRPAGRYSMGDVLDLKQ
jgi:4-hydroxy-tetrahydrodipicolinate reductase